MSAIGRFFRSGGTIAWGLIGAVVLFAGLSTYLLASTADTRYQRDLTRMVFNDNLELLEDVKRSVGASSDTLAQVMSESPTVPKNQPYLVVSIADHRVWFKEGNQTLFSTQVATGSGKVLTKDGGKSHWKFETPRGRLVVQSKESDPMWVPPDWHYVEVARKKKLRLIRLNRGQAVPLPEGGVVTVVGNDVVKKTPDGKVTPFETGEGKEIVARGSIVMPPFGTNQRKFAGVLGTHRLNLGDGYALHGTDVPSSIGQSVSHGCVRLRNEDIETLFQIVPVGTPVFIY